MRDYSKVNGQFWTGKTGKALRGDAQAQLDELNMCREQLEMSKNMQRQHLTVLKGGAA